MILRIIGPYICASGFTRVYGAFEYTIIDTYLDLVGATVQFCTRPTFENVSGSSRARMSTRVGITERGSTLLRTSLLYTTRPSSKPFYSRL